MLWSRLRSRHKGAVARAVSLVAIVACMLSSLTELWEQDVFWQVRAGQHLLKTGLFSYPDPWSYTASTVVWHDRQWLATALMGCAVWVGDIPALVCLRALVVGAICAVLAGIIGRLSHHQHKVWSLAVVIPLAYVAMAPRVQIRPDFIMLIPYTLMIAVWTGRRSIVSKAFFSYILMVIATNIHPGTALFALCLALALGMDQLYEDRHKVKAPLLSMVLFAVSQVSAWLMTPHILTLPEYLDRHIFYRFRVMTINPDHAPLSLADFNPDDLGPWAWVAAFLTVLTCSSLFLKGVRQRLPAGYRHAFIVCSWLFLFTGLTWNRQRAVPFLIIAQIPVLVVWLEAVWSRWHRSVKVLIPVVWMLFAWQIYKNPASFGLGINRQSFPVDSFEFIRQHGPRGHILHMPAFGDYMHRALPHYKVYADAREIPFDPLRLEIRDMYNNPAVMEGVLHRYGINTVVLPMSFFLHPWRNGDGVSSQRRQVFFSAREWAVVAYDGLAMVLVRRIPEHKTLIEHYAYQLVVPDFPLSGYIKSPDRQPDFDRLFADEISRCRRFQPWSEYCILVESRWLRRDDTDTGWSHSRALLERELAHNPYRKGVRIELARLYRRIGLEDAWSRISRSLKAEELDLASDIRDL